MTEARRMSKRRDSGNSDASSVSRIPISYTPVLPRKQRPSLERHRSLQCLSSNGIRGKSPRLEDDNESLRSGMSCCSSASQCEHAHFARNGTTYSGRSKKFIVHCSPTHGEPEKYLTPTQRAHSTIRRLQSQLSLSQAELQEKEYEIARLTRELVELRLGKAESDSPVHEPIRNGHSCRNGGGEVDRLSIEVGRMSVETTPCSLADSGHFEDISPAVSPRNTPRNPPQTPTGSDITDSSIRSRPQLFDHVKPQESVNAKIESLLHRLAEANDRYYELRPQYDDLKKKIEVLEKEKDELKLKFTDSEERHRQTYLQMFNKGQEAALFCVDQSSSDGPAKASTLPQLLKELEITKAELESVKDLDFYNSQRSLSGREAVSIWNLCRKTMYRRLLETKKTKSEQDAEVTLQFLKSAVYYFLTDRENATGHLAAIQSILGFSGDEKLAIEKASHSWK